MGIVDHGVHVIVNLHHHITAALYVGDRGHGHVQLIPTV